MLQVVYKERWFLTFLFVGALGLRICTFTWYLGNQERFWQVDSNTYHLIGTEMANGNGYSLPGGQPAFYRLPGYPFFLGMCYKFFGHNKESALLCQIIIASFIPILIFFLSLTLFPGALSLAKISALVSTCHLGLVLYAGFFMSESLFIFFFLLFALFFFASFNLLAPHKKLFIAGLFLGCASLIRPVGHYVIIVAAVLLLLRHNKLYTKIFNVCALTGGWAIPVSFLLLRNYLLLGSIFFHTLPGGHFLYLSAARVAMHPHHCSYQEARNLLKYDVEQKIESAEKAKRCSLNEIERCCLHEQLACSYFIRYPLISLRYWITDMARTMLSLYSAELLYLSSGRKEVDYFAKDRTYWSMIKRYLVPATDNVLLKIIIWAEIIFFLLMLLGFFYGLAYVLFRDTTTQHSVWFRVLPVMALFIVIALAGGYARMRLPIEPFLIILSLYGWSQMLGFLPMQE